MGGAGESRSPAAQGRCPPLLCSNDSTSLTATDDGGRIGEQLVGLPEPRPGRLVP